MNIFTKLAVTGVALSLSSFVSAAVSGTTDFRVVLPEVLVLYHWDDALLTLTNTASSTAINDTTTRTGSIELGTATAAINTDVDTTGSANALSTTVAVTLQNAWAVRSLSSAAGVSLALTNPNPNLVSVVDKTSKITTSGASLSSGSLTGATITIPSGFAPVLGDINFNLDLSGANSAGEYNTRGGTGTAGPAPDTADGSATDTFLLTLSGL